MRLLLVAFMLSVLLHRSQGQGQYYGSMFNRNSGLLQAFNGGSNDNNNRDTDGMYMYITKTCPCNIQNFCLGCIHEDFLWIDFDIVLFFAKTYIVGTR